MTFPYFENPQAWMPDQDASGMSLTRLDSFFAVLAPSNQIEISSELDYQTLVEERIAWMIRQWSEDLEVSLEETYQMIQERLRLDRVPGLEYQEVSQPTPERWAQTLAGSTWMSRVWGEAEPDHYPIRMAQDDEARQDAISTIEEQTLEEWLMFFSKQN